MNREAEVALRAVAAQFEATREDLERIAGTLSASTVPTLGEFAGQVLELLSGRTLGTYRHHILRLVEEFGNRRLDEVQSLDLERLAVRTRRDALELRDAKHGFGAQESFVNATRFLFTCAQKAGHLRDNPSVALARPRRRRSVRRALSSDELTALFDAVMTTSRDPELDVLILAFARETACRREGILNLRVADVQPVPSVMLYEKFDEQREIPISEQLERALRAHVRARPSSTDAVFRYRDGQPLTDRRFDTLFKRVSDHLPWAKSLGVSLHWIRYSTLTDIRMSSGERVASAYAGHGDQSGGITGLYTRATFEELRVAHRHLFGSGVRRADRACSGGASCI